MYLDIFCLHVKVQLFQHHFLKRLSFLHWIVFLLRQRSVDNICVGLIFSFLFCSLDILLYYFAVNTHFGNFSTGGMSTSTLLFRIASATLSVSPSHINTSTDLAICTKEITGNLTGIGSDLKGQIRKNWHLNNSFPSHKH